MKALASHPSAAQSLTEDDSLQLLFQMVANGSLIIFSLYKEGLVPLHSTQLHRHAMQVVGWTFPLIIWSVTVIQKSNYHWFFDLVYEFDYCFIACTRSLVFFWSMTLVVQQNTFANIIWYVILSTINMFFTFKENFLLAFKFSFRICFLSPFISGYGYTDLCCIFP